MPSLTRLASLLALLLAAPARAADPPKLIVLLVVDQMRADYVDWYGAQWKGGLRRLYDQGAWLRNARYPYLTTLTCPGHFTIGTGTFPRTHGMVLNTWYDRERKKVVDCTDDPGSPLVSYPPAPPHGGDSPRNLVVPALADEMSRQLSGKPQVAAFAMKPRSALGLAGHAPTVALWFDGNRWVTSRSIAPEPTAWVSRFIAANPINLETPWTELLPPSSYANPDDAEGERPGSGWSRTFPHPLAGSTNGTFARWVSSPASNEYLVRLAEAALTEMKLGQGSVPDLLAVSFSSIDLIGHQFGPRSHELQDALARLDLTLGGLLEALDRRLPGRYLLALTSDHGVALIPEQTKEGGRLLPDDLKRVNAAIAAELGPGQHVVEAQANDVYLAPGVRDRLAAKPGALTRVLAALRALPGIAESFDGRALAKLPSAPGPRRMAALSYFPGRSGDLVVVPRPHWVLGSFGTNHGTGNDYDQRVPLIFFGPGVKPGKYDRPVSPADVAPTLARSLGIEMPRAEGKPIPEVLPPARRAARRPH